MIEEFIQEVKEIIRNLGIDCFDTRDGGLMILIDGYTQEISVEGVGGLLEFNKTHGREFHTPKDVAAISITYCVEKKKIAEGYYDNKKPISLDTVWDMIMSDYNKNKKK